MIVVKELCRGCGICVKSCSLEAVKSESGFDVIDPDKCEECEECVFSCPNGAISG